jgi:hypothetical protein
MNLRSVTVFAAFTALPVFAGAPALNNLKPGAFKTLLQQLPVNIVFVGYAPGAGPQNVDLAKFSAGLPAGYRTVNRYPGFYGNRQYNGVDFTFQYKTSFAPTAFTNAFFNHLTALAVPAATTIYQDAYNAQTKKVAVNVEKNHFIDAVAVEKWLAANGPAYGIDTTKYTIFYINWYGRPDFRFHLYTKTDEPDPDTNYNFGQIRASRKIIAWGGSVSRTWFYDLSAGPDFNTGNYNVDTADITGNKVLDYRIPPVWEYGNTNAYRKFDDLSGDLSKVTRFVAINLLFTPSPLYKTTLSPPKLAGDVQVDVNLYQGNPGKDARAYYKPAVTQSRLAALQPYTKFSTEVNDLSLTGRSLDVYKCFLADSTCFGKSLFGIAFGDLFLQHDRAITKYIEGDAGYEVPVFAYFTTPQLSAGGLLGFADDNWRDGTQSYVFAFLDPTYINVGYGLTTTITHEVGHHLGLSHPHDGYDSETGADYGPEDAFYYVWAGDESHSIMHYLDLTTEFGQFNKDGMARYMTSAFLNQANAVLASIDKSPRATSASMLLYAADGYAGTAISYYQSMSYQQAAIQARLAYDKVLAAAASINVQVEPQNYTADYKSKSPNSKFVDSVGYPSKHRQMP